MKNTSTSTTPSTKYLAAAIGVGALTLSGCAGSASDQADGPDDEARIAAAYPAPDDVSIVGWLLNGDPEWGEDLQSQGFELTFDCMRNAGFNDYPLRNPPAEQGPPLPTVLTDLPAEQARTIGYDSPQSQRTSTWVDPVGVYFDGLTDEDRTRFSEANAACAEQEREVLFDGNFDNYDNARSDLDSLMLDLFDEFYDSDAYRDLSREWSGCMADAGFDFDTPTEAVNTMLAQNDEAAEIATATADSACRDQVDTRQQTARLFREFEVDFLLDNEELVLEVMELSNRSIPRS